MLTLANHSTLVGDVVVGFGVACFIVLVIAVAATWGKP